MFIGSHYDYTFIIIYKFDEIFLDDCNHDDHNDVEERVSWYLKKKSMKNILIWSNVKAISVITKFYFPFDLLKI